MADEDETSSVALQAPTQCALWEHPELARGKFSQTFELVEEYVDDRDLERSLWKCKECGQLYFREWFDWDQWRGGNGKLYVTLLPVQTAEEIEALKQTTVFALMRYYPRLHLEGREPRWFGKD